MGLRLPPALSINKFEGGYKAVSDFTDLNATETFDSNNVIYTEGGVISKRFGSERLLNSRLTNSATTSQGEAIVGHYFYKKLGNDSTFHIVMAGNRVFNYSSATAIQLDTGYTTTASAFFTFVQCQDPRSAGNDIAIWTNGVNPMVAWDGSAAVVQISNITSATQAPIAKYLALLKNRIYAANQFDSADSDAGVRVSVSSFGSDGLPDPHRYLDHFYCGGSDKDGEINGAAPIEDQMAFYTRQGIWKFAPGAAAQLSTASLRKIKTNVGLLAPRSLVNAGEFHIFLSDRGVYAFDGVNVVTVSDKVNIDLLQRANISKLDKAVAAFDAKENKYHLYYAAGDSTENDTGLVYDLNLKIWQPPITGRRVSCMSTFENISNQPKIIYGDYKGYLYEDSVGLNDGISVGYNGTSSAVTSNTLSNASANFSTAGDGLSGQILYVYDGTGKDNYYYIQSNTSDTLTIEETFAPLIDSASSWTVGGYNGYWRSKDYEFGAYDLVKLFRYLRLRLKEIGNITSDVQYIVDFKAIDVATKAVLSLLGTGMTWSVSQWDNARWGSTTTLRRRVSIRSTKDQSNIGNFLAIRIANQRANETFTVSGFDIEYKEAVGKRNL